MGEVPQPPRVQFKEEDQEEPPQLTGPSLKLQEAWSPLEHMCQRIPEVYPHVLCC